MEKMVMLKRHKTVFTKELKLLALPAKERIKHNISECIMLNPLLLATTNTGKIQEFKLLLTGSNYSLVTPKQAGLNLSVAETGCSFNENALRFLGILERQGFAPA